MDMMDLCRKGKDAPLLSHQSSTNSFNGSIHNVDQCLQYIISVRGIYFFVQYMYLSQLFRPLHTP